MSDRHTSTLLATEQLFRPLVLGSGAGCTLLAVALLGASRADARLGWLICALASCALVASNLHYLLTHAQTTVGMIPVSLFSLLPALIAASMSACIPPGVRIACLATAVALGALLVVFVSWFCRLRRAYRTQPDISPAATLIVLGGAIRQGRPCETLARRLDVAARLWLAHPDMTIVCTGGPTPDHTTTEADEMARYLQERGVARASIVLEREARNTRENIARSCKLLDQQGLDGQRCVVSSDYHLWRALREARMLGIALTPIPSATSATSILQQWCREVLTILFGR